MTASNNSGNGGESGKSTRKTLKFIPRNIDSSNRVTIPYKWMDNGKFEKGGGCFMAQEENGIILIFPEHLLEVSLKDSSVKLE
jgi:hypothetical protein